MGKEPIGLYILRYILSFGLFAFMGMLYWSSQLQEQNLKNIRSEIAELKSEVGDLKDETQEMTEDVLNVLLQQKNQTHQVYGLQQEPEKSVEQDKEIKAKIAMGETLKVVIVS